MEYGIHVGERKEKVVHYTSSMKQLIVLQHRSRYIYLNVVVATRQRVFTVACRERAAVVVVIHPRKDVPHHCPVMGWIGRVRGEC